MSWLLIPFIIQALAISVDEYVFHIKRGLPRWERIGHPLDTLSVLICLVLVLVIPFSASALKWFIGLSIFSCLMVTKDEFVHKHHCPASEHWLHALLFLNHPILLTCTGLMWKSADPTWSLFLMGQALFVSVFFLYQVIYWNFIWKSETE